jgi:hypothetical protein
MIFETPNQISGSLVFIDSPCNEEKSHSNQDDCPELPGLFEAKDADEGDGHSTYQATGNIGCQEFPWFNLSQPSDITHQVARKDWKNK